ncbi:probable F-box protein At4g22030 [Arachis stenosperma]|uniref:probable F-box protein At4g22030 n=1 Tax=Arachis stenosperma TaxID=217475 RepID=UPI0025AB7F4F|nr:probable F-box protein At4g22030 [Arachis stenosperma]
MMAFISTISIHPSTLLSSRSISSKRLINAAIRIPKLNSRPFNNNLSMPKIPSSSRDLVQDYVMSTTHSKMLQHNHNIKTLELLSILEAVAERAEIHKNVGEQRDNWNKLLLNSINMITLAAATMVAVADSHGGGGASSISALNLSSTLLFSAATGMLLVMNKIQPSQLAEEQRKATRSFKQLQTQIETTLALGVPTEEDVKSSVAKVLAIEKAYPLPLLGGAMLEKFPAKFEPAVWWPRRNNKTKSDHQEGKALMNMNGWSEELEMELREVIEVVKRKDVEDYERLGNKALKANKTLAIAGPLLTAIAALGSVFVTGNNGAGVVSAMAGSMAAVVNAFEHGGQVGMVFEMYRNCGGFFKQLEETVEATLEENDFDKRENGQVFELKVALQLGRSVSQLRELASKSASCRVEGISIDEFASKMF